MILAPVQHILANKRILLASASLDRYNLLSTLNLKVELCLPYMNRSFNPKDYGDYSQYVVERALCKAEDVYNRMNIGDKQENLLVIAAETIVIKGSDWYDAPLNRQDCIRMLSELSGKCNRVLTGVVLKHSRGTQTFTESADLYMKELSLPQIEAYVDSNDGRFYPGAFNIDGTGSSLVYRLNGDVTCVRGLPLHRLCTELLKIAQLLE